MAKTYSIKNMKTIQLSEQSDISNFDTKYTHLIFFKEPTH